MKKKMKSRGGKIALIIFLAIIAIALVSVMIMVMVNKDKKYSISLFAFGDKTEILAEKEYDINEIKNISVNTSSSNVKFVEGSSDKVKVTVYGLDKDQVNIDLVDDTLEITKEHNRIYIFAFLFWNRDEIVVEVPKSYEGNVGVKLSSGNVEMIDLENANVTVEGTSGNVRCRKYVKSEILKCHQVI